MDRDRFCHRKSEGVLRLLDAQGKPLHTEKVSLRLCSHAFFFGCGAFDVMPLVAPRQGIDFTSLTGPETVPPEKASFYQERVDLWTRMFNYGTIPFYWGRYEPIEGEPLEDSRQKMAQYLVEHGAKVKGHPLCWHTVCADWLMEYDNKTILEKQLKRIDREVSRFRGLVDIWDVINEVVIMPVYDRYDNAITRICKELGRVRLVKEVFEAAKAANPDALLLINDFDLSEKYRILLDGCLNAGVPIGAIGLQTHQHQGYHGKEWLEEVLDRYSFFGLPLHFTENTLISGELMPKYIDDLNDWQVDQWPTTPEGEERQAREWKEMLTILFAHPKVEAVTGWDFADGAWLGAPSGLVRRDNSEKPAYKVLYDLIHREWTTQLEVQTDSEGKLTFTGYRGTYEVECQGKKASFILEKNGGEKCLTLA